MYQVIYRKAAAKGLMKMPIGARLKMKDAFSALSDNPDSKDLDVKKLIGRDGYRLRVGQWRAIYRLDNDKLILLVVDTGSRGDIYK